MQYMRLKLCMIYFKCSIPVRNLIEKSNIIRIIQNGTKYCVLCIQCTVCVLVNAFSTAHSLEMPAFNAIHPDVCSLPRLTSQ